MGRRVISLYFYLVNQKKEEINALAAAIRISNLLERTLQMYKHDSSPAFSLYRLINCAGLAVTSIVASFAPLLVIDLICVGSTILAVFTYILLQLYHLPPGEGKRSENENIKGEFESSHEGCSGNQCTPSELVQSNDRSTIVFAMEPRKALEQEEAC